MEKTKIFLTRVNEHLKNPDLKFFLNKLSKSIDLPNKVVLSSYKQYISRNHNFLKTDIESKISFLEIIFCSIKYIAYFFYAFIFSKDLKKQKKVKIIFDDILNLDDFEDLKLLIEKFSDYKIITSKNLSKPNELRFVNRRGYFNKLMNSKIKEIFLFIIIDSILFSKKIGINLVSFADFVVNQKLKYETIFMTQKSDILFEFRPYNTSSIKKHIFKNHGGKFSCTYQRILTHLGRTGYFIDADIIFSLGAKSASILGQNGSVYQNIIPVGSILFEKYWFKSKKFETPKFDIIYLGGNNTKEFGTDNRFLQNYYEQLNWLKKLNKKYSDLNIVFKHHLSSNYIDHKEDEILKDTSIKIIKKTEQDVSNKSYGFALNSKVVLTWCSTMGYELLGHNIPSFYLDPNYENDGFLHNFDYNKKFRLNSYSELEKKIDNIIFKKKYSSVNNSEDFCYNSENTSQNIFNHLKKLNLN